MKTYQKLITLGLIVGSIGGMFGYEFAYKPYAWERELQEQQILKDALKNKKIELRQKDPELATSIDSLFSELVNNPKSPGNVPTYFRYLNTVQEGYEGKDTVIRRELKRQEETFGIDYQDFIQDIYENIQRQADHFNEKIPNEDDILSHANRIATRINPNADLIHDLIREGYSNTFRKLKGISETTRNNSAYLLTLTRIGEVPMVDLKRMQALDGITQESLAEIDNITPRVVGMVSDSMYDLHFIKHFAMSHGCDHTYLLEAKLIEDVYAEAINQARDPFNIQFQNAVICQSFAAEEIAREINYDTSKSKRKLVEGLYERANAIQHQKEKLREKNPVFADLMVASAQTAINLGKSLAEQNKLEDMVRNIKDEPKTKIISKD